jgi:hypothetical protein
MPRFIFVIDEDFVGHFEKPRGGGTKTLGWSPRGNLLSTSLISGSIFIQ